jgi:hypothetical protein
VSIERVFLAAVGQLKQAQNSEPRLAIGQFQFTLPHISMRIWLLIVLLASYLSPQAEAQKPFLRNVQLTSREIYEESMRQLNPGEESTLVASYQFTINITAAISPEDAALFDENTAFSIGVGSFSYGESDNIVLGLDENYEPGVSRSARFVVPGTDINSDQFEFGVITLNWSSMNTLLINITFTTAAPGGQRYLEPRFPPEFTLRAYDGPVDNAPETEIRDETSFLSLSFGPYTQEPMVFYSIGQSTLTGDDLLTKITLNGATDFTKPTATITVPPATTPQTPAVTTSPIIFQGTVRDRYVVGGTAYTNTTAPKVEFSLSTQEVLPSTAVWTLATVSLPSDSEGFLEWQSASPIALNAGVNFLHLRATDAEGNTTITIFRRFIYSTRGVVTVTGASTGFPSGDAGKVVGVVSGAGSVFPGAKKISIKVNESPSPASDTRSNIEAGRMASAVAKPGPGAIFNGWTATYEGLPLFLDPAEASKEKMTFFTRPRLVVIGNFVPNPFLNPSIGVGAYFGNATGTGGEDRGTFAGKVAKTGAFSGKVILGALTLPVKGKFLGNGKWDGIVSKKGINYTVSLNITVVAGLQKITGTVTGGSIGATIDSDRLEWKKRVKEATAYAGNYNVILPITGAGPTGIGYGRVAISPLGKVKFVGKAGTGEAISFSSALFERSASEITFPFYAPVEKKLGNISGTVSYDATAANSDLTGSLKWSKPTTFKVEPALIDTTIALHGSRYIAPGTGGRVILGNTGAGNLAIRGPSIAIPVVAPTAFLNTSVVLGLNHQLGDVADSGTVTKTSLKFSPATGLFTGKFFDPAMRKSFSFAGVASQKANAGSGYATGLFIRGNRTGHVELSPAP